MMGPRLGVSLHQTPDEAGNEENQEHDKQDLRDFGCADCDTAEAEHSGDQSNQKKYNGVMEHDGSPI
jgi:hypothetical protein